jgi:hypothetical protein
MKLALHPYQLRMARHIISNNRCALWAEMGLGKTAATLLAIKWLITRFRIASVLVIGPPRVMEVVWPDEMVKWEIDLPWVAVTGSPKHRAAMMMLDSQIKFMSVNHLSWLLEHYDLDQYDMIVIDEAHYFKSHSTKRWKLFSKAIKDVERIVELTGTPAGNGLMDVWAQVHLLDYGARLGHPYSYFRDRYFESDYMGYNWTMRTGTKEMIYSEVADICTSLSAADYLEMPDIITKVYTIQLNPKAREQYESLERDFLLTLEDVTIVADSAAVLTQKLQQAASGAIYDGDGQVIDLFDERSDALTSIINDNVGEPILVTYTHRFQIDQIKKKYPKAEMVSSSNVARWNAGEIPILICHPSNLGLNLQDGGHILVWFGLTWNLTDYQQTVARLWRQGQTKPVIVHQIVCAGTVDEVIVQAIKDKETGQRELLERVKMSI